MDMDMDMDMTVTCATLRGDLTAPQPETPALHIEPGQ